MQRGSCLDREYVQITESKGRAWDTRSATSGVGIGAVLEQPLERRGFQRFARREDDREIAAPAGVHIGAVRNEQLHHRNAFADERRAHQRSVPTLVDIRAVLDHPRRHSQPLWPWRLPWNAALRDPRERSVFAVAERCRMERGVARHRRDDAVDVVSIDCRLELSDLVVGDQTSSQSAVRRAESLP